MADADLTGILLSDAEGRILFQSGCACDPSVQRAALAAPRPGDQARWLHQVTAGGRTFVALACRSPEATLHVLHENASDAALLDFVGSVDFAYAVLNHFVTSPFHAVVVVDADAKVRYLSPVNAKFFGVSPGEWNGRPVTDVLTTRLPETLRSGHAAYGQIWESGGVSRVVSRVPIREDGKIVGAIGQVLFKGPEQLHELSRELTRMRAEVAYYKRELSWRQKRSYGLEDIVGRSAAVRRLKAEIARVAPLDVPVLLVGESGTGKELVAHSIHALSPRQDRGMVLVNAAALPATLVESELFGYEPGAFTGAARKARKGKFELADRSTLFLDEIGDMPLEAQAKLLRVLQDGTFERVGGERVHRSDFRLVAATNRNLLDAVDADRFRLDLYYRISGVVLQVPPLRERLDDVPLLVERFIEAHAKRHGTAPKHAGPEVIRYLQDRPWPGNVRQLLHEVQMAAVFAEGPELRVADFRGAAAAPRPVAPAPPSRTFPSRRKYRSKVIANQQLTLIKEALARNGGNKKRVAAELGISRSYLYKRLREGCDLGAADAAASRPDAE